MSDGTPGCAACALLAWHQRPCEECREAAERPTRPLSFYVAAAGSCLLVGLSLAVWFAGGSGAVVLSR